VAAWVIHTGPAHRPNVEFADGAMHSKIDPELRKEASMSDIKVLTLLGSLRAASVNRQIAG
jgi:hypothetical protein